MDIKLTNGRKIITKEKKYYEANLAHFTRNGFFPVKEKSPEKKVIEKAKNVVKLKPRKKKKGKK